MNNLNWDDLWDRPQASTLESGAPVVPIDTGTSHRYAAKALEREAQAVADAPEGTRNDALNTAAFRMGRHVGAGTIGADVVRDALAAAGRAAGLPAREIDLVLRDDTTSAINQGAASPRIPPPLSDLQDVPAVTVLDLDDDAEARFWASRPLLTHLHTFARARRVSPWAVLGVTLARMMTRTPHQVCLPPIVGGKASLNLFVGLVGPSGAGKGGAEAAAADAVELGHVEVHTTGSGEGIAHGFVKRVKGEVEWHDEEHAVLFSVSEIDTMAAQGDRRGSTLFPELRRAWSGERLGFGYADPTKRLPVPAHEYRLCLVAGIQPARAHALLDDADGGTPQRFLWLSATDPDAPDDAPDEPKPLTWRPPSTGGIVNVGGARVDVCDLARTTITDNRLAQLRGGGEALDGHALLARLKVAAALGIADGRYSVTEDDWHLAGVVMQKSDAVRGRVTVALAAKAAATNAARADAEADRAVHVETKLADSAVRKACQAVVRKLRRESDWVAGSELRRGLSSQARPHLEDALERLLEVGQIQVERADRGSDGHGGQGVRYRLADDQ